MLDTLKFTAITAAALVVSLIALTLGAMLVAGLAVAGAITAIIFQTRARGVLRRQPHAVVIEGEYFEIPQRAPR